MSHLGLLSGTFISRLPVYTLMYFNRYIINRYIQTRQVWHWEHFELDHSLSWVCCGCIGGCLPAPQPHPPNASSVLPPLRCDDQNGLQARPVSWLRTTILHPVSAWRLALFPSPAPLGRAGSQPTPGAGELPGSSCPPHLPPLLT